MPDTCYTVKLEHVEGAIHQAFSDMITNMQSAMNRVAQEHNKLQDAFRDVVKEDESLSAENKRLRDEVARLSISPQMGVTVSGGTGRTTEKPAAPDMFKLERTIKIHDAPVHSVAMATKDSVDQRDMAHKTIATASWDATVKLYDLASEEVVRTLGGSNADAQNQMGGLYAVAFAKTAPEILGCTSCDKSVYLWNHVTGARLSKLTGHSDEVNGIDFHHSQQVMCTASDDCRVIVWDFQEGITLRTLDKHTKQVYGATFLGIENQYFVATCCFDQKTRVFDMRDKQVVAMLTGHSDDVIGIDYSSPKQLLATGSDDGLIIVWDTRSWKILQQINTKEDPGLPENEVKRVAFSQDGGLLAAACSSGAVLVYDIAQSPANQVAQLRGHTDCVFDVTWGICPNTSAKILVSASHDHTSKYWRGAV